MQREGVARKNVDKKFIKSDVYMIVNRRLREELSIFRRIFLLILASRRG